MGKLTGFMEYERHEPPGRDPKARVRDWLRVPRPPARDDAEGAGRALHGLRRPVLPHGDAAAGRRVGLPDQQPDPGVERPRLPRAVARGARRACTRPTTSPSSPGASARRRARDRACSASTSRRSRSRASRPRSSTRASPRAGSSPSRPRSAPARRWRSSGRARRGWRPRRSSTRRATPSPCSSATTASAAC